MDQSYERGGGGSDSVSWGRHRQDWVGEMDLMALRVLAMVKQEQKHCRTNTELKNQRDLQ